MKYRLDTVDQANFTVDSEGYYPYESKWSKPVSRLDIARTVFSVRSVGLEAHWYKNLPNEPWPIKSTPDSSYKPYYPHPVTGPYWTGIMPIVKFWYENYPPVFGTVNDISNWGVLLSGKFQAPHDGTVAFDLGGQGEVHSFKFDGVEKLGPPMVLDANETWTSDTPWVTNKHVFIYSLTGGQWYPIQIFFKSNEPLGVPSGLVVHWSDGQQTSERTILSAGITALNDDDTVSDEMPIPYRELDNISKVTLDRGKNTISKLTFTVPLVSSGSSYEQGYAYSTSEDHYYSLSTASTAIKPFWMVRYQEGYQNSSDTDEMVTNFVGQVRDIKTKLSPNKMPELQVTAYDYGIFLKDAINTDSPNILDYLSAGYRIEVDGHVNGSKKPSAYDGWEVYKAVQNMMVNSYIDPFLFTKKKIFTDYDGNSTAGSYLMHGIGITPANYLPVQENYGNPDVVTGDDATPDDEYLYGVNVGESYYDMANKVLEPYAMNWGFTSSGYPFIEAYNSPIDFIDDRDMTWAVGGHPLNMGEVTDINSFKGTLTYCVQYIPPFPSATFSFTGNRLSMIADGGSQLFKIWVRHGATLVASALTVDGEISSWGYYEGVNPIAGFNPCIHDRINNLPYDTYDVTITNEATIGTDPVSIDAAFVYDRNVDTPSMYLKSGDTGTPASIISIDIDRDAKSIRNESVVIGSRLGITVAQNENHVFDSINPNNPQYEHIVSRTLDINSVYSTSAANFVGRPLTTLVFDPSINDQDQADFIGFGLVNEFREPNQGVTITALNNPLIDVGDCLGVKEEKRGIVSYDEKVWVESISTTRDSSGKHTMTLRTTPVQPVTSWFSKTEPDLSDFNNQPFQNVRIYNTGVVTRLNQNLTLAATAEMVVDADLASAPPSGYARLFNGESTDITFNPFDRDSEIIKYEGRSTAGVTPGKLYHLTRGLQYTQPVAVDAGDDNDHVIIGYDPYTQDGMGIYPIIKFDLVKTGEVECWIDALDSRSQDGSYADTPRPVPVDNLAWDGNENINFASKKLIWGADRSFIWGGLDNIGRWNKYYTNDPNLKIYQHVFLAEQAKQQKTYIPNSVWDEDGVYPKVTMYPYTKCRVRLILTADDGAKYSTSFGNIYVRRGHPACVDFKVNYDDLVGKTARDGWHLPTVESYSISTDTGPVFFRDVSDNNYFGNVRPDSKFNVVFTENSNNGKGLRFDIRESTGISNVPSYWDLRNDSTADVHHVRYHAAHIEAHVITGSWWFKHKMPVIQSVVEPITIYSKDSYSDLYKSTATKYFYPTKVASDIGWFPVEIRDKIVDQYRDNDFNHKAILKKIVIFKGHFEDKSGRYAFTFPVDNQHYLLSPQIDQQAPNTIYGSYTSDSWPLVNNGFYDSTIDQENNSIIDEMSWRGNYVGWIDTVGIGLGTAIWQKTTGTDQQNIDGEYWEFGMVYEKGTI